MRTKNVLVGFFAVSTMVACQLRDKSNSSLNARPERADQTAYMCDASSAGIIIFMPQRGEVHFLNADGVDAKQHEDGLSFRYQSLETSPPTKKYTIVDDEGEVVGGWTALATATTWETKYRGKTYKNCRKASASAASGGRPSGNSGEKPADVTSAKFDPSTDSIVMEVSYGGGCKEHKFRLKVGTCLESIPPQCDAIVVDDTHDDHCEAMRSDKFSVSRTELGFVGPGFKGTKIYIRGQKPGTGFPIILP